MANDQNKYIKQTFNCSPIIEVLYSTQSKYYLYVIYQACDEVWSGKASNSKKKYVNGVNKDYIWFNLASVRMHLYRRLEYIYNG